jgi:threonine dehydrogenase-like Zn-dependent dehydrogenase
MMKMRANIMYAAGDVRVEEIPVPKLQTPTDAILKVVVACIYGSDLHPYHNMHAHEHGEGEASTPPGLLVLAKSVVLMGWRGQLNLSQQYHGKT